MQSILTGQTRDFEEAVLTFEQWRKESSDVYLVAGYEPGSWAIEVPIEVFYGSLQKVW